MKIFDYFITPYFSITYLTFPVSCMETFYLAEILYKYLKFIDLNQITTSDRGLYTIPPWIPLRSHFYI